jgi:hypothetical protein
MVEGLKGGEAASVKPKRWTVAEWMTIFEEYRSSGLTVRAFCHARDLLESAFYRWRRKILSEASVRQAPQQNAVTFAEVSLPVTHHPTIDLKRGDISIALPETVSPATLRTAILALGELSC